MEGCGFSALAIKDLEVPGLLGLRGTIYCQEESFIH